MRNATCTTIAPTGSISLLARCSSGIEPLHSLAFSRRILDGRTFTTIHPLIEKIGRLEGWLTNEIRTELVEGAPASGISEIPAKLSETLVTAHNVSSEWHVRMQAAFQENVDNAVSKTVNLPTQASVGEVDRVFRLAYELSCKGITVYRDGSREGQTLSANLQKPYAVKDSLSPPRARERVTAGRTFKYRMGCGTLFVTVNRDTHGLCEVFANLGKAGGCPSQSEATCRAISAALRSGVNPRELSGQLRRIRCLSTAMARKTTGEVDVLSCPDAIARAIEESLDGASLPRRHQECPECGAMLRREAGCRICSCGYSACG
jgi:ribonucleoside-diphosphate reductase alpha chain